MTSKVSRDHDADYPPVARALKQAIADVDAVLFVTPEFNRSMPGGLKNAIDRASRPWGKNSFAQKPSAVIGTSPGLITADGEVTDEGTRKFLQNYMAELHAFIVRVLTVLPRRA